MTKTQEKIKDYVSTIHETSDEGQWTQEKRETNEVSSTNA